MFNTLLRISVVTLSFVLLPPALAGKNAEVAAQIEAIITDVIDQRIQQAADEVLSNTGVDLQQGGYSESIDYPQMPGDASDKVRRELQKLGAEHDRKVKKLEAELNRKLRKLQTEFEREAGKEDKAKKIAKKRRKLEEKTTEAYRKFEEKLSKANHKYDQKREKILSKN